MNDAPRLSATLAALAPAAIDGFVREVIVADGGSTDATLEVADDAGADVVTTGLTGAIAAARQPWLLILAPGARPQVGWEQAAHAHMRDFPDKVGWFDLALPQTGAAARLREFFAALFGAGTVGLGPLIERQLFETLPPVTDLQALSRVLGRARTRRIGARALMMN
jgi:glycosyltransferase involved in cell wall biosynthesis